MIERLTHFPTVRPFVRPFLVVTCCLCALAILGSATARALGSLDQTTRATTGNASDRSESDSAGRAVSPESSSPARILADARTSYSLSSRPDDAELLTDNQTDRLDAAASLDRSQRNARAVWMEVTAYCPCPKCCGPNARGVTASGKRVSYNRGRFVAADTQVFPFGTKLSIPGYHAGEQVEVVDRGGAIKGHRLDVYFPSHQTAKQWGRRWVAVTVAG